MNSQSKYYRIWIIRAQNFRFTFHIFQIKKKLSKRTFVTDLFNKTKSPKKRTSERTLYLRSSTLTNFKTPQSSISVKNETNQAVFDDIIISQRELAKVGLEKNISIRLSARRKGSRKSSKF